MIQTIFSLGGARTLVLRLVTLVALVAASPGFALGAGVVYLHGDLSGSPLVATDANGYVVWKENYAPFGKKQVAPQASSAARVGFHGKPVDNQSGLAYQGARYYDPSLGRFLGVDPVRFDPENIYSFNRYAFANNNPYRYVDPDGHTAIDVVFLAYDLYKLGKAIGVGSGIGSAASDVVLSAVGVISPVPFAGQALKAGRAIEHGLEAAKAADHAVDATRAAGTTADISKAVPNPHGKLGGPEHQAKVREVMQDIRSRNLEPSAEFRVLTPNGQKGSRFVDVLAKDSKGNVVEMHQVGKQTKGGQPIARERKALDDIQNATGERPQFHPYNY